MVDILTRSNALGSEFDQLDSIMQSKCDKEDRDTSNLMRKWFVLCRKQQSVITDMAEIIHTNSYVQASIHDNVIASLDASVKPSNVVQVKAVVNKTPDRRLPRPTNSTDTSLPGISAVTSVSIDDMLTPIKAKPRATPKKQDKKTPVKQKSDSTEFVISRPSVPTPVPKIRNTPILRTVERFKPGDNPFIGLL